MKKSVPTELFRDENCVWLNTLNASVHKVSRGAGGDVLYADARFRQDCACRVLHRSRKRGSVLGRRKANKKQNRHENGRNP